MTAELQILCGDAVERLRELPAESVHCCVTSPPYWGLRDYSTVGQIGLEKTPEEYVGKMVEVFREVRRVLRKDGTLWLNLGDSYAANRSYQVIDNKHIDVGNNGAMEVPPGLKPKDLCGIPWRVAFALQADGWWLRSDIIWAKPNPMPESVTDRPTKSHEYLFLLTKSANYFYDAEAIKERQTESSREHSRYGWSGITDDGSNGARTGSSFRRMAESGEPIATIPPDGNRNKRSVWTVATAPYPEAHFATYPPDLIKPCILAGTSAKGCCAKCGAPWDRMVEQKREPRGDNFGNRDGAFDNGQAGSIYQQITESKTIGWQPTCFCDSTHETKFTRPCIVLDPFAGSGTTGAVALELGCSAILIELNPKYVGLIRQRCDVTPGLALA